MKRVQFVHHTMFTLGNRDITKKLFVLKLRQLENESTIYLY